MRNKLPQETGKLTAAADAAGLIDWSLSVDSTIARAHQHATNITRTTEGWIERHERERSARDSGGGEFERCGGAGSELRRCGEWMVVSCSIGVGGRASTS